MKLGVELGGEGVVNEECVESLIASNGCAHSDAEVDGFVAG